MHITQLDKLLNAQQSPVILLEGRHQIPAEDQDCSIQLGAWLAKRYPHALFRSGIPCSVEEDSGAFEHFVSGVLQVDPSRLHIVAAYARHLKRPPHPEVTYHTLDNISPEQEQQFSEFYPKSTAKGYPERQHRYPLTVAYDSILTREIIKLIGTSNQPLSFPTLALFYNNPDNPRNLITEQNILICQQKNIPAYDQGTWKSWLTQ